MDRRVVFKTLSAAALGALALSACQVGEGSGSSSTSASAGTATSATDTSLGLDGGAWSYDADNDVYWQIGVSYLASPAAPELETLGVFVPGAYLKATANDDGTYTAEVDRSGTVGGFTSSTAPIVFPVNTPGYAAQQPPAEYSYDSVSAYLEAGFVYVAAGMRGKDTNSDSYLGNAPWGVTDLKAAIRYVRHNTSLIPGDTESIFVFGHSGGGAQSAVMGSSGDSGLYRPYLSSLGAAMTNADGQRISDAVAGVMAWCPITNLDDANAAYEWNMGQFASSGTRADGTWTAAYSHDLAEAYAGHVNKLRLTNTRGQRLRLRRSSDGVYLRGTYHDHVVGIIEESLNNFLADTTFPYTAEANTMAGMDGSSEAPSGEAPSGEPPSGEAPSDGSSDSDSPESTTYATVADYIAYLNTDTTWVEYDEARNRATILSLEGFVLSQKSPSKDVGAFDGIDRSATENLVFGNGEDGLHFATVSRDVITRNQARYSTYDDWDEAYAAAEYTNDFATKDSLGKNVLRREAMYNPMYFLSPSYRGYGTSTIAPHWRIRSGIMQGDTANTTEINLALALQNHGVENVDFATVWGQGHTQAERTGDATTNFIGWVKDSLT